MDNTIEMINILEKMIKTIKECVIEHEKRIKSIENRLGGK